jgi:hypothetical protein
VHLYIELTVDMPMILQPSNSCVDRDHHGVPDEAVAEYHGKHCPPNSQVIDDDAEPTVLQPGNESQPQLRIQYAEGTTDKYSRKPGYHRDRANFDQHTSQ